MFKCLFGDRNRKPVPVVVKEQPSSSLPYLQGQIKGDISTVENVMAPEYVKRYRFESEIVHVEYDENEIHQS